MKKLLVLLLLTVLTVLPTFAVYWVQVAEKHYVDIDSIEPYVDDYGNIKANQYFFWEKILNNGGEFYRNTEKTYQRKVWYMKDKCVIDISRKVFRPKCVILYDLNEKVIDTYTYRDSELEWTDIVPDSIGDNVLYVIKKVMNRE